MGIKGLLPALEHTKKPVKLHHFSGKRVAIDGHCWLHNGLSCCAFELETNTPTEKYISAFRNKILQLLNSNVIPVVVFDGDTLPLKADTVLERQKKRKEARDRGFEFLRKGDSKSAYEEFRRSAQITPEMINNIIKMLNQYKVEHIKAPYEADPQLVYLCKIGYVDAILTMDSDLLVFGCPHIIFQRYRLDDLTYIQHAELFTITTKSKQCLDLTKWTPTMFRHLCILVGCDYVENIRGMGLKTAYKLIAAGQKPATVVRSFLGKMAAEEADAYMKRFKMAEAGFLYQIVYDPKARKYTRLNPLNSNDGISLTQEELALLGTMPSMEPLHTEVIVIDDEEEEEAICPSLSTTKGDDDEEEEDILSTPCEPNLPLSIKSSSNDNKVPNHTETMDIKSVSHAKKLSNNQQGKLEDSTNKITAQALALSFQQKNTTSLIRQKSVLTSMKRVQTKQTTQTTLQAFISHHQLEKKRKIDENVPIQPFFS